MPFTPWAPTGPFPNSPHSPDISIGSRILRPLLVAGWTLSGVLVARAYSRLWQMHGPSPLALMERDEHKTVRFYEALFSGVGLQAAPAVLDIGCGQGHLIDFLHTRGIAPRRYIGIDLVLPFIEMARRRHQSPYEFQLGNFVGDRFWPGERFDVVVALGVLVTRVWAYEAYLEYAIWKMLTLSRNAVLFNVITEVDTRGGNYPSKERIGGLTAIPKHRLLALLDRLATRTGAQFSLYDTRIYPDATDTFVYARALEG